MSTNADFHRMLEMVACCPRAKNANHASRVGHKARLEGPARIARSINKFELREQQDYYRRKRYVDARLCGEPGGCQEVLP